MTILLRLALQALLLPNEVSQIFSVLHDIAQQGIALLLIEQNAYYALKIAKRGYVMVNGEIVLEGKTSELAANPNVQALHLGG